MNKPGKLTTAVFKSKLCPKWAQYAAVNRDGTAYYYDQEPDYDAVRGRWMYAYDWYCGEFDASDWEHSLIKRPVTNLDWLCKHPQELAYLLAKYDGEKDTWFAPGCKRFDSLNATDGTYSVAKAQEHCIKYIAKWLKQEHKR